MKRSVVSLCLLHLFGNALLLCLGYYWLGISESDAAHLAWSGTILVGFICARVWLHGTALAFFQSESDRSLRTAGLKVLRHLIPLFVIATVAIIIYGLLAYWRVSFNHKAFVIASYITMKLRKPVSPSRILSFYQGVIWLVCWLAVPVLLLPLSQAIASSGWRGFRVQSFDRSRNVLYWLEACGLLFVAIWIPLKLITWIPQVTHFNGQMASFAARFTLGYLSFVGALLSLEFATSRGKPREIHPSTASSP
jgi:hypothetical protein